jgi:hypothetical protein
MSAGSRRRPHAPRSVASRAADRDERNAPASDVQLARPGRWSAPPTRRRARRRGRARTRLGDVDHGATRKTTAEPMMRAIRVRRLVRAPGMSRACRVGQASPAAELSGAWRAFANLTPTRAGNSPRAHDRLLRNLSRRLSLRPSMTTAPAKRCPSNPFSRPSRPPPATSAVAVASSPVRPTTSRASPSTRPTTTARAFSVRRGARPHATAA